MSYPKIFHKCANQGPLIVEAREGNTVQAYFPHVRDSRTGREIKGIGAVQASAESNLVQQLQAAESAGFLEIQMS